MPQDPSHASHTTQPVAGGTGVGQWPGKRTWLIANLLGQIAFGLLAMTICLPGRGFKGFDWVRTTLAAFVPFGTFLNDPFLKRKQLAEA
jgi:hypothetical protein